MLKKGGTEKNQQPSQILTQPTAKRPKRCGSQRQAQTKPAVARNLRSMSVGSRAEAQCATVNVDDNSSQAGQTDQAKTTVSDQQLAKERTSRPTAGLLSPSVFHDTNLQEVYKQFETQPKPDELDGGLSSKSVASIESAASALAQSPTSQAEVEPASQLAAAAAAKTDTHLQLTQTPSLDQISVATQCDGKFTKPVIAFDSSTNTSFSDVRDSNDKHYLLDREFVEQLAIRTNTDALHMRGAINDLLIEDYLTGKYSRKLMFPIAVPTPMTAIYSPAVWRPIERRTETSLPTAASAMNPMGSAKLPPMPWHHDQLSPPPSPNVQPRHQMLAQRSSIAAYTDAPNLNYSSLSTLGQCRTSGLAAYDQSFHHIDDEQIFDPNVLNANSLPYGSYYDDEDDNELSSVSDLWNRRQRTSTPIRGYDRDHLDDQFGEYGPAISPIPNEHDSEDRVRNPRFRGRADTLHYFANEAQPADGNEIDLNLTIDLQDMSFDDRMETTLDKTSFPDGEHSV